jgi:hypothetical protein
MMPRKKPTTQNFGSVFFRKLEGSTPPSLFLVMAAILRNRLQASPCHCHCHMQLIGSARALRFCRYTAVQSNNFIAAAAGSGASSPAQAPER